MERCISAGQGRICKTRYFGPNRKTGHSSFIILCSVHSWSCKYFGRVGRRQFFYADLDEWNGWPLAAFFVIMRHSIGFRGCTFLRSMSGGTPDRRLRDRSHRRSSVRQNAFDVRSTRFACHTKRGCRRGQGLRVERNETRERVSLGLSTLNAAPRRGPIEARRLAQTPPQQGGPRSY